MALTKEEADRIKALVDELTEKPAEEAAPTEEAAPSEEATAPEEATSAEA